MAMYDVGITQGAYWKGGQIPYWLYLVFVILFGVFGLDHLLLRSPSTAILKIISIVPLLGFWYFYDIAQAIGEWEHVEKFGLGVPFYGPVGLGAGMFINKDKSNLAPPDVPKPWMFMLYALTTIFFLAIPLNKLVIGDYWGMLVRLGMYMAIIPTLGISALIALGWGIYDIYALLFKTRYIFENGVPRISPAMWIGLDANFRREALGPGKPLPPQAPQTLIGKTIDAAVHVPLNVAGAASTIAKAYGDTTATLINTAGGVTNGVIQATEGAAKGVIQATEGVTVGLVNESVKDVKDIMATATGTATDVITTGDQAAKGVIGATAGTVTQALGATGALLELATKMPAVLDKVSAAVNQKGGAMSPPGPSGYSTALIFGVALLAFSGYVMYTMRKTMQANRDDRSDDSPPDARPVRAASKARSG